MAISEADERRMQQLAHEGKQISRIRSEDYPHLDYWDVYWSVYGQGGQSSQGIKKMITNRLRKLVDAPKPERTRLAEELQELVAHLYQKHKDARQKLDAVRRVLDQNS